MLFSKAKYVFLCENTVTKKASKIGFFLSNIEFYKMIVAVNSFKEEFFLDASSI